MQIKKVLNQYVNMDKLFKYLGVLFSISLILYFPGFTIAIISLITLHELGHYFAARHLGYYVSDFSIGFGKSIFHYTDSSGTKWNFRPFLLGGFVNIDMNSITKAWHGMLIGFAGPLMNFILAPLLFFISYSYIGSHGYINNIDYAKDDLKLEGAYITSIKSNVELDSQASYSTEDSKEYLLYAIQNGEYKAHRINSDNVNSFEIKNTGQIELLLQSLRLSIIFVKKIIYAIAGIFSFNSDDVKNISGVIGIAQYTSAAFYAGIAPFLIITGALSLSLFVFNLLPIAPLDGHIMISMLYKQIFGVSIPEKAENIISIIGISIVVFLSFAALYNDIVRIANV